MSFSPFTVLVTERDLEAVKDEKVQKMKMKMEKSLLKKQIYVIIIVHQYHCRIENGLHVLMNQSLTK